MSSGRYPWRIRMRTSTVISKRSLKSRRRLPLRRKNRTWLQPRTEGVVSAGGEQRQEGNRTSEASARRLGLSGSVRVAVFNLNVVPSIAANGGVTVWLWILCLVLFFWPQGIAVIELAHRYPGEGGVYLWAKEVFAGFRGFLSRWCYWTNNMMYVPTGMLYFVGVSVFLLGPGHQALADNRAFTVIASLLLMALLVILNIVGLGVGKWINNIGGIGTGIAAAVLIGLGLIMYSRFGTAITAADFRIPANPRFVLNSFGVICFGLVGLELASVMGDEIKDPQKTLPGAVAWGGILSGLMYIATTLTLLIAVSKSDINVLQGIVQAVSHMASRVGADWIVAPFALMLSISIAGFGSGWLGGCRRLPPVG